MVESLLFIGSLMASLAAVAAFLLGVTKTARLRRREQTLRESMAALPEKSAHRNIVVDLHKITLAELIGRQLTSPFRVIWPWLAWLAVVLVNGQAGYLAAEYLSAHKNPTWSGFATATLGDPFGGVFAVLIAPFILSVIFLSQYYTLVGRAEVARQFYDGKPISRPESFMRASTEAEFRARSSPKVPSASIPIRERLKRVLIQLTLLGPGLFVIDVGLLGGVTIWLGQQDAGALESTSIQPLGAVVMIAFLVLGPVTLFVVSEVYAEIADHALPTSHSATPRLVVSRRRRARVDGTVASPDRG